MKMMSKFFCLLMVVAMLVTSTFAVAEETATLNTITLSDFNVTYNGESVVDLSGLALALSGAYSDAGVVGQVSVLGGDTSALSAQLAGVDNKLVVSVPGLSKAVSLTITEELMNSFSAEDLKAVLYQALEIGDDEVKKAALDDLFVQVPAIAEGENMTAMMEAVETYQQDVMNIAEKAISEPTEATAEDYTFAYSNTPASSKIEFNMSGEDMKSLMMSVYTMYDSNPAILAAMNDVMILADEEPITSFTSLMEEEMGDVSISLTGDLFASESGDCFAAQLMAKNNDDDEDAVAVNIDFEQVEDHFYMAMDVAPVGSDDSVTLTVTGEPSEVKTGATEITAVFSVVDGGEEDEVTFWCGPEEQYGDMFTLSVATPDEQVGIAGAISENGWVGTVYSDDVAIEFGYDTSAEGMEAGQGLLYANITEGDETYEVSAVVTATTAEITTEEIAAMADVDSIDVLSMTDDDISSLMGELSNVAMNAVMTLATNVPGIGTLLGMN